MDYSSYSYKLVKKKKIKFLKNKVKFNPIDKIPKYPGPTKKVIRRKVQDIIKMSDETNKQLQDSLNNLVDGKNSSIKYTQLKSYTDLNDFSFNKTEKYPHTSLLLNINEKINLLLRCTTKKEVEIFKYTVDINNNLKETRNFMKTHTPYKGLINSNKVEYKTNIIQCNSKDINFFNNKNILNNYYNDPSYKDVFKIAFLNSISNSVYF